MSTRTRAIFFLILATAFWGVSFPLVKGMAFLHERLLPGSSTWFIASMVLMPRFVLAALLLAVWQSVRSGTLRCTRGELVQGVVIGLFSSAGMICQSDALQFTAASTSAFLTQLYVVFIPVYLMVRTRRNPGAAMWTSVFLVIVGVSILGNFDWRSLRFGRGEWETMLGSLFFAGQILWLEKAEYAGNRPEKISLVMYTTLGVVLTGMVMITAPDPASIGVLAASLPWWLFTVILMMVCTVGAYGLMNAWQPKITATEAGLIYCVEPIFGSLMALFLPSWLSELGALHYSNETMTSTLLVGGSLITAANVLLMVGVRKS
ncbi:MAG: DMT family transporter [Opitutaceae bacterium]|nr:DMT family transporter [Opitutaceae bacterium]